MLLPSLWGVDQVIDLSQHRQKSCCDTLFSGFFPAVFLHEASTSQDTGTCSYQHKCFLHFDRWQYDLHIIVPELPLTGPSPDVTVFADVKIRAANGRFLHVPLLGGTTANENDIFTIAGELVTTGFAKPVITGMVADISTLLGVRNFLLAQNPWRWTEYTQGVSTCAAGEAALFRVNGNVPTWRYQYQGISTNQHHSRDVNGSWHAHVAIFPGISTRQDLRAFHSSEIQMVFGTYNTSIPNPSSTVIALSRYVQSAWVAFARNPRQGLINFGWPLYNPNTTSLAQLGGVTNQTGVAFTQGSLIDSPCANSATLIGIQNQLLSLMGP